VRYGRRRMVVIAVLCATLVTIGVVFVVRSSRPEVYKTTVTVDTSGKIVGGINSHYVGLSFESGTLNSGKFDNIGDLAQILRNLGSGVMRFGGNSVDQASFTGATAGTLAGLARLADTSGWTVLYSENLGTFGPNTSRAVRADARNVSAALGSHLAAIACGNEPDAFRHNGIRSSSHAESEYLTKSANCLVAVRARAPDVMLAGPDTAGTSWLPEYAARDAVKAGWLDQHYYALGCKTEGRSPGQLADTLLSPAQVASEVAMFSESAAAANAAHAQLHISETNSACGGGLVGLSDTYASALWAVDYMLTGAEHGVDGMNFHGGLDASCQRYTPLCQVGANEYATQPIYYGMLFTHLFGSGHLLPVAVSTSSSVGNVAAFALRTLSGGLRLIVENLSPYQTSAALRVGGHPGSATVLRLTGPSLLATSGVRIQGAAVAADGSFTPGTLDSVQCSSGNCPVTIAPYSAMLVTVG
jgi:hypothetical protein